jgi:hypothetical protein
VDASALPHGENTMSKQTATISLRILTPLRTEPVRLVEANTPYQAIGRQISDRLRATTATLSSNFEPATKLAR